MYGEWHTVGYPTTKPSRWNDFKDLVNISFGVSKTELRADGECIRHRSEKVEIL